jgi:predicted  nucleic acid-binding Zn-ribbon protein
MSLSEGSVMPPETDLAVAIAKIESISGDMAEVKATMRELAAAVSRLAVIEERQSTTNDSIGRAFKDINALSARVTTLEQAQPIQKQSSDLVQTAVKYIVAAVLGAVIAGFVRIPPAAPTSNPPAVTGK